MEEGFGFSLERDEVEVRPAVFEGDHELGGIGAKLDGTDPMPASQLSQEPGMLSEKSIVGEGQHHEYVLYASSRRHRRPRINGLPGHASGKTPAGVRSAEGHAVDAGTPRSGGTQRDSTAARACPTVPFGALPSRR